MKELTYEQENLILEANKEKKIQEEIEEEERRKLSNDETYHSLPGANER